MSGAKRASGYRKGVTSEVTQSFPLPGEEEHVARVVQVRGGNQVEVAYEFEGEPMTSLALLPTKFKNLIWIKRGDNVIVTSNADTADGTANKGVRFLIKHVLYKDQVRHIKANHLWPPIFSDDDGDDDRPDVPPGVFDDDGDDDDDDRDLFVNTNKARRPVDSESSDDEG